MTEKNGITAVLTDRRVVLGLVSAVSFASGAGLSYLVMRDRLKKKYEEIANEEVAEAKEFYKHEFYKNDNSKLSESNEDAPSEEFVPQKEMSPEDIVAKKYPDELLNKTNYSSISGAVSKNEDGDVEVEVDGAKVKVEADAPVVINVFEEAYKQMGEFDYESEIAKRSADMPYIITEDEYMNCEMDFEQYALTFFGEDGVLVDDQDNIVDDVDRVVGNDNLERFGHGSKDKNMVYIRNERLEVEYEVLYSNKSFSEGMFGIKHSEDDGRMRRRSKRGDYE